MTFSPRCDYATDECVEPDIELTLQPGAENHRARCVHPAPAKTGSVAAKGTESKGAQSKGSQS